MLLQVLKLETHFDTPQQNEPTTAAKNTLQRYYLAAVYMFHTKYCTMIACRIILGACKIRTQNLNIQRCLLFEVLICSLVSGSF